MLKIKLALVVAVMALAACPSENKTDAPSNTTEPTPASQPSTTAPATPPADTGAAAAASADAGPGTAAPSATAAAAGAGGDPKAEADQIFSQRCSVCHGMNGKGDGPGAAALNPKPRDYTDQAWQKSVTDDYIAKVIVEGGAAVGKSPTMVANADLKDKPEVVKALVAKVRSFGGGAAK